VGTSGTCIVLAIANGTTVEGEQIWLEEFHKHRAIRAARYYTSPLVAASGSTAGEDGRVGGERASSAPRAHLDANPRPCVAGDVAEREDLADDDEGILSDSEEAAASN